MKAPTERPDSAIRIYTSKWKMGGLALPCFFVAYSGLAGVMANGLARSSLVDALLLLIGVACGAVMLWMAFETEPVLTIDERGITCRRPPTGLIPWHAVAGLGVGRVSIMRRVLLIAIDEPAAEPALADKLKRYKASSFLNPTVARFQGQLKQGSTVQVPVSLLNVKIEDLQRMLEERVNYVGD